MTPKKGQGQGSQGVGGGGGGVGAGGCEEGEGGGVGIVGRIVLILLLGLFRRLLESAGRRGGT
jgi:hypothetical protein